MKKIQIQHHCTPEQARQLYDAVKAAGLEYPPIDWAFYIRIDGGKDTDYIWRKEERDGFCEVWPDKKPEERFIPCPTLAELQVMTKWNTGSKQFMDWLELVIHDIKNHPEAVRNHWSKLQEESKP